MTIEEVIKGIYDNQELLKEQIKKGDKTANNVANLYNMVRNFAEHVSITLLICAYEDWCKENSITA
ncbi:hypothetical protein [Bacillus thuringiensis]|uniref:hypothetical protein n=1 Tax=Bacillus thuringiensis TaxID=1428 RepID=UPI0021D668FF|nr:hypothetical protein [Bacillus thuringiensis]MCU7667515.1 hypothetical protein [Bacillus thuringiensis]